MVHDFRIDNKDYGRFIERSRPCHFFFDGKKYEGFAGDSVASALLANGVKVVGRSFKYHRRRGISSADVSEANALVTILEANGGRTPNCRACDIALYDGLRCESQNRFPSLDFDILAVNGLFSRFMPAGFYYKTFMGPLKRSWMWFEPLIRRAAGLGKANHVADDTVYDEYVAHPDVLVIGGGSAGIAAALAAGASGCKVVLAEMEAHIGGALLSRPSGGACDGWLEAAVVQLESMANVRIVRRLTVFGWYDHNICGAIENAGTITELGKEHASFRLWRIYAGSVILAAGALERPIGFGNNDLPGIMLSSALRRYVHAYGVLSGREVVVFTNDDSGYDTAFEICSFVGVSVSIVDARSSISESLRLQTENLGIPLYAEHAVVNALGRHAVEACDIAPYDLARREAGRIYKRLDCDLLVTAGGWTPTLHLHSQIGDKPIYDENLHAFLPRADSEQGHFCVGSCAGIYDIEAVIASGARQGSRAARFCGFEASTANLPPLVLDKEEAGTRPPSEPLFFVEAPDGDKQSKIFLDFQNDVSLSDVRLAAREGYLSVEHMKRYTTLGMATDQGKTSNMAAFYGLSAMLGKPIAEIGTTTFRPPYVGVPIGAFAGRETGMHLRPLRRMPLHAWHLERGAKMVNVGMWQRSWYYPRADNNGEDSDEVVSAYIREMTHVRASVGLTDVSTLGKIIVAGPDAAEFLNRVYINGFKTLGVGRCRYGVMLRDDGFVLDDGTVTRLGECQYFITTTTGEAEIVFARLEFLLEAEWTDLRVHVVSVTDEWCGLALAGPAGRDVLMALVNEDVSDSALPYMGFSEATLRQGGLAVRLHRISFSGELGYEIYVRSGFAEVLAEACMQAGSASDIDLYGLEAMGALRIEKGFLTASEIDGRHCLEDLCLSRMASSKKPYLGGVLRHREAFLESDRPRLVGLRMLTNEGRFRNGALIYGIQGSMEGHGLGHVSSVTWSPSLNCYIALGFVAGGDTRLGERVRVAFPLRDEVVEAEIVSTNFLAATDRAEV